MQQAEYLILALDYLGEDGVDFVEVYQSLINYTFGANEIGLVHDKAHIPGTPFKWSLAFTKLSVTQLNALHSVVITHPPDGLVIVSYGQDHIELRTRHLDGGLDDQGNPQGLIVGCIILTSDPKAEMRRMGMTPGAKPSEGGEP